MSTTGEHMGKLTRENLYSLEKYVEIRADFRSRVLEHKKSRQVAVGPHARLYFEDPLTIQYQVQEMLRVERIFEPDGIEEELSAYNPLIPDGGNWKVTFMLEYADAEVRKEALRALRGVEDRIYVQVEGSERVFGVADEDLERATEEKTSAVHFLRFDLSPPMVAGVKRGAGVRAGVDHPSYRHEVQIPQAVRASLSNDLAE
ncbi:MAG: DUF3501 family protein [Acidiferrobacteraceae bacterium]